jgi:hypothetical protein
MFDGQHKTSACWLLGRKTIVVKLYIGLSTQETIALVNSIQAVIPKLPLSTFELSAKMDDETKYRFERYLESTASPSEAGFIAWLPTGERDRGRSGFRLGLSNRLVQSDELILGQFVQRAGTPKDAGKITETAFKTKLIDPLLYRQPLSADWDDADILREREAASIIRVLNTLAEKAFLLGDEPGVQPSEKDVERRRRMSYQSSLAYVARLLRRTVGILLSTADDRELMDRDPTDEQWMRISGAIDRLVQHPIWTADFELSARTKRVAEALAKNQDAAEAFRAVSLTPGYLVGDPLPATWYDKA